MTYKKGVGTGGAQWQHPYGIVVTQTQEDATGIVVVTQSVGHRAEALQLVSDILDLLAQHAPVPCPYEVHDDGTLRTKDGNVIAACADRQTAAFLGIVLDRFEAVASAEVAAAEDPLPWRPWKGPYA